MGWAKALVRRGVHDVEEKVQGRRGEGQGGVFDNRLGLRHGHERSVVDPLRELPSPPAFGSEPVRESSLGHGSQVSEGMEVEPVKSDLQVGVTQGAG